MRKSYLDVHYRISCAWSLFAVMLKLTTLYRKTYTHLFLVMGQRLLEWIFALFLFQFSYKITL